MLVKEFLDANPSPIEPGYVFALLTEKTKDIYYGYVKKAADSLGLRCESFLDFNSPGDALRDILASIQKAEILVYDITDFTPNVMWELGVALAIKDSERVIIIREKSDASLPFDIYTHGITFEYDPNSEDSLNALRKALIEVMRNINKRLGRAIQQGGAYDDPPEGPFASGKGATAKREEEDKSPPYFQQESYGNRLPAETSWDELMSKYTSAVVEGQIKEVTELGIFVTLSKNFTGLIHWKYLEPGYEQRFSKNQLINVRISSVLFDQRAQKNKVKLQLVDAHSEDLQPKPVLLGASAPQAVSPNDSFVVRFLAYTKKQEEKIKSKMAEIAPGAQTHLALKETRWRIGTRVKIRLSSPHLLVSSPEVEFTWRGTAQEIPFTVQAPATRRKMKTVLEFDVSIGGISIAKIGLDIEVDKNARSHKTTEVETRPATSAFASYASQDRKRVIERVAEVRLSGLDVFMDHLSLKPGEEWKTEIEREIRSRDLFLLFWSADAKKSKWVEWEWKTALKGRGKPIIQPRPLVPVAEAEPPKELKHLHFGDPYMLIRKAYEG